MTTSSKLALPIDPVLPELLGALATRGAVVLQAPPGAGKTTRVPPALLDRVPGQVLVLEPRRLAARMSARRVADELGERLGGRVGFEVRFERAVGDETRLIYVTEGILGRRLLEDPTLRGVGAVVLDEFHERHLQGDLALALLRRLRQTRPELALVVMSATLDAAPVARFLDDAPIVTSEGRRFEVAIEHLPRVDDRPLHSQVASAVRRLVDEGLEGDVLVFLPGAAEIRRAAESCAAIAQQADLLVLPLHGDLPPAQQDRAIFPADRRKVVLSTNVAETSITIDGVVAVIDSGLARVAGHDPWTGRTTLEVTKVSRASTTQRAGRAGRTRPGRALRLYTKGDHDSRPEHDAPEILRTDLAETLLQLRVQGVTDVQALGWLDPPPRAALESAEALCRRLGALETDGAPSAIGRRMTRFPLPPRLARALVEAERRGVAEHACAMVALVAEGRDLHARSFDAGPTRATGDASSDLLARLDELAEVTSGNRVDEDRARRIGLDVGAVHAIERVRRQLLRAVQRGAVPEPGDVDAALRLCLLAGFPDRVARRRIAKESGRIGASRELLLAGGGSAVLEESSVVATAPWLVAVDARDRGGKTRVWLASEIDADWLLELFPDAIEETIDVSWNAEAERVEAIERLLYDRLVLDERPAGARGDEAAARLLAERVLAAGVSALASADDAEAFERLRARVRFVVETAPDLAETAGIRALDDAAVRAMLVARCAGKRAFAELRRGGFLDEVRAHVGHAALARLDRLAPDSFVFPNARRAKIEYPAGQPPSLSSRLQDFFGRTETPRVLDGRVPLVLHLLAPNGRDVQITTDLIGFWDRHYATVRSELRRRYPRHAWPDDPRTAEPSLPRRRGS